MRQLAALAITLAFLLLSVNLIRADCVDEVDCQNQINQQNAQLASIQKQQADLQKQLDSTKKSLSATTAQLNEIQKQVDDINRQLDQVTSDLKNAQDILDKNKSLFRSRVRDLYVRGDTSGWELLFGSSYSFADAAQFAGLKQAVINRNKELIIQYSTTVASLDSSRAQLADAKKTADDQLGQIQAIKNAQAAQVSSITKTQSSLNNQVNQISTTLANLTSKQKEIIAAKSGGISSPIGDIPPTGDPASEKTYDPGFRPAFAVFSFGAYTHRNGMSQYGALGRANSGQSAETILAAYYPGTTLNKNYSVPSTITVSGTNEYQQTFDGTKQYAGGVCYVFNTDGSCKEKGGIMGFQEYVKHLYEVPSSWPAEVLKAQAVAARSYAIRYSSPICPSQNCQVVKWEINATAWQQAVDATNNWVLTGGSGSFQYSSTSGGYLNTSGWDTTTHDRSTWLTGGAYEAIAGSPWFYKGWYKSLYGATCGRTSPWLTQTEFTDLLNAYVVYNSGNSTDKGKVYSTDYASCFGSSTPDTPYTIDEMRNRAAALLGGSAYTSVSAVSVAYNDGGYTSQVTVATNRGTAQFDGQSMRDILNLRLPGRLAAKTELYNIETKF